jgi:hypothetical protein
LGANITLVHAEQFDAPPYFTQEQLGTLEAEGQMARRGAEGHVRAFAAAHGLPKADVVISDLPAVDAILHAADGADLLILGAHGRRALRDGGRVPHQNASSGEAHRRDHALVPDRAGRRAVARLGTSSWRICCSCSGFS